MGAIRILQVLAVIVGSQYAAAQTLEEIDIADALEGFSGDHSSFYESGQDESSSQMYPQAYLSGELSGHFSYAPIEHTTAAGYDVSGVTAMTTRLALSLDGRISPDWSFVLSGWAFYDSAYSLRGREDFSRELRDEYEKEAELGETFIRGKLSDDIDFSFGRQVVVWGKADLLSVVDLWNPVDNRHPGLTDHTYARLPVWLTKVDLYPDPWQVSAIVSHEYRHGREPVIGHDFYPYDFAAPSWQDSGGFRERSSAGLMVGRCFPSFDIDFYGGSFRKDVDNVGLNAAIVQRSTMRISVFGFALEKAIPHWLFKLEAAWVDGLQYYSLPGDEKNRLDVLLGADYTGLKNTRVSLEIVERHLFDLDGETAARDDTPSRDALVWAFRFSRTFLRDRLNVLFLSYAGGYSFQEGSAQRISADYAVTDSLSLTAGLLLVHSGDNYLMRNAGDNDRIFFHLKYVF
ncbi:MAG: DUF1302 family protein [Desulfopila sp.]|nr:DUF1302 family protein [Desulfopila sp.]